MTSKKVTVFTGNGCAYCPMVKKFLTIKRQPFEEINVDEHPEYSRGTLQTRFGQSRVPVTVVGEEYAVGWNPSRIGSLVAG